MDKLPDVIRNVCILAHVDHGKTTLADYLISSNGIISAQSAGKLRYLDSREDEQRRFITVKSSCVSLSFKRGDSTFCINLIDSPGHVDFTTEVTAATALSDGALLLIDVIEGVCAQTKQVIARAAADRVKLLVVLNKMDRLFTELNLSALDAYKWLCRLLENLNSYTQKLVMREALDRDLGNIAAELVIDDNREAELLFIPEKGNVLFASSLEGWATDIPSFAAWASAKLKVPVEKLTNSLWGDYYLNIKTRDISNKPVGTGIGAHPIAVTCFLHHLWLVHQQAYHSFDPQAVEKMARSLSSTITVPRQQGVEAVRTLLSAWSPLATRVLDAVVRVLPSPVDAAQKRASVLCPDSDVLLPVFIQCSPKNATVLALCTKLLTADFNTMRLTADQPVADLEDVTMVALCRVFSGSINVGDTLFCTTGTQNPVTVKRLFRVFGQDLADLKNAVGAGEIVIISFTGLDRAITDTILAWTNPSLDHSSFERSFLLCSVQQPKKATSLASTASIVRVCLEPQDVKDSLKLLRALAIMYMVDPALEVEVTAAGEILIGCLGEVHLEKTLNDLEAVYGQISLKVTPPIVACRETIAWSTPTDIPKELAAPFPPWQKSTSVELTKKAVVALLPPTKPRKGPLGDPVEGCTPDGSVAFRIRSEPIPGTVLEFLEDHADRLNIVSSDGMAGLEKTFKELWVGGTKEDDNNNCCSSDGRALRPPEESFNHRNLPWPGTLLAVSTGREGSRTLLFDGTEKQNIAKTLFTSIVNGFRLASCKGPLCHDPVVGVAVVIENVIVVDPLLPESGTVMSCIASLVRESMLLRGRCRIYEGMNTLDLSCDQEVLGKVYAVVAKRRGRVTLEELQDGTSTFHVSALIPVSESFGLSTELMSRGSGNVAVCLQFSHYEVLSEDPFPEACLTEEEIEDEGHLRSFPANVSRKMIIGIRRRKGLPLDEKIVVDGTKQRTLARKK